MNESVEALTADVPLLSAPQRVDRVAARLFDDFSRSRLQRWIKEGRLLLDGRTARPRDPVIGGEHLSLTPESQPSEHLPENLPVPVCYEDNDVIVVDKPEGLVVHPGAGNPGGTLMNGLLFHFPELSALPRAGIVHRLDRDTTGLMVVARSLRAHKRLVEQLQERSMGRQYLALVHGVPTGGGMVDRAIGRHPVHRTRMAVVERGGKEAVTRYKVEARFSSFALLRCKLETGRTHQIRVHMAYRNLPLVGDPVYGRASPISGTAPELVAAVSACSRQMLHATELEFDHPGTGEPRRFTSDMPADMAELLKKIELADAG